MTSAPHVTAASTDGTGSDEHAASTDAIRPGLRIQQYELIRELGRGGMGTVWASRDTRLGRRVAIKFLLRTSRDVVDRFLVEARATAQCNHDNIVIVYEADEHAGMPYMVLEFLEGQSLRSLMSRGPLPASRVVELALPIARALTRAHELGIVHRDLKPENVFVTTAGQVKVLDFGIAKALGAQQDDRRSTQIFGATDMHHTRHGALVGTLPYMSPEQLCGQEIDERADLWALGIMLFEMLAGAHPIQPLTFENIMATAAGELSPPSLRSTMIVASEALRALVDDCLQHEPTRRIAKAWDIVGALEELLPGRTGRKLREGESPYPGLLAFQEQDADRFFGRDREIARMVTRLRDQPITGVIGPSGAGKSSFIRAGVGPALKASGERWEIVPLRPGRYPLAALAAAVDKLTLRSSDGAESPDHYETMRRMRTEPGYIGARLRSWARQRDTHVVLFVDQMEELHTLVSDEAERRMFTAALSGIADDPAAPLRVVVSMRSDFLDRLQEDVRFFDELSRGLVFLSPPDRAGLRDALVQPLERVGYRFESPELVEEMIQTLVHAPGALPLLQFAAAKLWDARDSSRARLTRASYDAIGGVSGALAVHADEVIASMSATEQRLTQKILRRLVTPERTRAILELTELRDLVTDPDELTRVIDRLVTARLLVVQKRTDAGGSVELVHESLIDRWPALQRWLDEDQEDAAFRAQLAAAAKQWEQKGRPSGLLWRGEAMEEARRWKGRLKELSARDHAFLDAVLALARRGKRMRQTALVGGFVLLGSIATAASLGFMHVRRAEQATSMALAELEQKDRERRAAEAERLRAVQSQRDAEAAKQRAEREKQAALETSDAVVRDSKTAVEVAVKTKDVEVGKSREALQAEKEKLEVTVKQLRASEAEKDRVATDLKKAYDELEKLTAQQRARIRELEKERQGLASPQDLGR